jgi:hypothetical protein
MQTPDFKNRWNDWKKEIQLQYPDLTDEDLQYHQGKEADLVLKLEQKTKKNKEEIYNWLHLMG